MILAAGLLVLSLGLPQQCQPSMSLGNVIWREYLSSGVWFIAPRSPRGLPDAVREIWSHISEHICEGVSREV